MATGERWKRSGSIVRGRDGVILLVWRGKPWRRYDFLKISTLARLSYVIWNIWPQLRFGGSFLDFPDVLVDFLLSRALYSTRGDNYRCLRFYASVESDETVRRNKKISEFMKLSSSIGLDRYTKRALNPFPSDMQSINTWYHFPFSEHIPRSPQNIASD